MTEENDGQQRYIDSVCADVNMTRAARDNILLNELWTRGNGTLKLIQMFIDYGIGPFMPVGPLTEIYRVEFDVTLEPSTYVVWVEASSYEDASDKALSEAYDNLNDMSQEKKMRELYDWYGPGVEDITESDSRVVEYEGAD